MRDKEYSVTYIQYIFFRLWITLQVDVDPKTLLQDHNGKPTG